MQIYSIVCSGMHVRIVCVMYPKGALTELNQTKDLETIESYTHKHTILKLNVNQCKPNIRVYNKGHSNVVDALCVCVYFINAFCTNRPFVFPSNIYVLKTTNFSSIIYFFIRKRNIRSTYIGRSLPSRCYHWFNTEIN